MLHKIIKRKKLRKVKRTSNKLFSARWSAMKTSIEVTYRLNMLYLGTYTYIHTIIINERKAHEYEKEWEKFYKRVLREESVERNIIQFLKKINLAYLICLF